MRLSIVTETFLPDVNGVAMTLHRLATGLERQGYQIQIIRPQPENQSVLQFAQFEDVQVMGLPIPGYAGLRFGLPCPRKLHQLWKENRPDAVYIATEGPLGLSALDTADKLGIPATSGFHTNFQQYMGHYKLPLLRNATAGYLKWFHNRTRTTFTPSPCMMRRLGLLGFENLQLLGRGVDTELFTPSRRCPKLRKKWGAAPEDPVLLYVGRVAAEKNLELFVKSYKQLRKKHPRIRAVIVGDGPEKDALRKEMPDAHFAGTLQGEQLAAHYASADLFLFPSLSETFGNVVTEAMASGLVTLAFNYAAPKLYIKDGFNGFTAKLNKEKDFLRKAEQILEDQANWPSLRKTAHESVQHLAWDSILGSFEQTHRQLAGDREQAA